MLPYLPPPTLGPVTSFGILVMVGVTLATVVGLRHAERLGLDVTRARLIATYCGIGGLLGAHYVDLFFYQPGWWETDDAVWRFINPFAGISSYGGLLGGTLGFLLASRKTGGSRLRYADAAALGVVVLMTFGRAGCASVHDHVGVATDFALAVDFPRGNGAGVVGPHHDLGLYELALWALVLLPASLLLVRAPRRAGLLVGAIAIAYAVPRFFLDLLRRESIDPRYLALTPAQWLCVASVIAGAWVLLRARRGAPPEPYRAPTPWRVYVRGFLRP